MRVYERPFYIYLFFVCAFDKHNLLRVRDTCDFYSVFSIFIVKYIGNICERRGARYIPEAEPIGFKRLGALALSEAFPAPRREDITFEKH